MMRKYGAGYSSVEKQAKSRDQAWGRGDNQDREKVFWDMMSPRKKSLFEKDGEDGREIENIAIGGMSSPQRKYLCPSYCRDRRVLEKTENSCQKNRNYCKEYLRGENRPKTHKDMTLEGERSWGINDIQSPSKNISILNIPKSPRPSISSEGFMNPEKRNSLKMRLMDHQNIEKSSSMCKKHKLSFDINDKEKNLSYLDEIERKMKQTEDKFNEIKRQHEKHLKNKRLFTEESFEEDAKFGAKNVWDTRKNKAQIERYYREEIKKDDYVIKIKDPRKVSCQKDLKKYERLEKFEKEFSKEVKPFLNPCRELKNERAENYGSSSTKSLKSSIESQKSLRKFDEVCLQDFILKGKLGQGQFGIVHKAYHIKTGSVYALKQIEKQKLMKYQLIDQFIKEVKIQSFANHQNLACCYGIFDDKEHIYMILEYFEGGSLYEKIKKFHKDRKNCSKPLEEDDEAKFRSYIKQTCESLAYLHKNGIYHRDIKPENILFASENICKLADFGCATTFKVSDEGEEERRHTLCGTFDYSAPQLLGKNAEYDHAIDLWGIGVLAYEILMGKTPFYEISKKQTAYKITHIDENKLHFPQNMSKLSQDFISKILKKAPEQRMNCSQMLEHPFLKQILEDL